MLYLKKGFPEEGELVLCTVTKVQFHSVFAKLDEYEDKAGMLHISEVSPGRIRNIRDYVVEGKVIVCVVLRINMERGHIDLSLRRVNDNQKKKKLEQIKQEQKAEKIVEFLAKEEKKDLYKLYDEVFAKVAALQYSYLYPCFEDISFDRIDIKELGLTEQYNKVLLELIKQRIKPPEVLIHGKFKVSSYDSDGVLLIKEGFKITQDIGKDALVLKYMGAGQYDFTIKAEDYKTGEKLFKEITEKTLAYFHEHGCTAEMERIEA